MSLDGTLFILVGPSGAGKNTLMKRVQRQLGNLPQLPTVTTRAKRDDEEQGREHDFVSHETFQHMAETGAFIEYQPVHMGDLYGTPRRTVEQALGTAQEVVADIEVLGAGKIYEAYPDNTVLIFVTPSRLDTLAERIRQRGNISPHAAANRLERAKFEMTFAPRCHYLILNDMLEPAVEHLRQIIMSERQRRRPKEADPSGILARPVVHSAAVGLIQHTDQLLMRVNSAGDELPTFPIADHTRLPHEVLQQAFQETLNTDIQIDAISDKRFGFIAPHYVTMAAIPRDIYVYFYYKGTPARPESVLTAGWAWRPLADLPLPATIKKLVTW